MLLSLSAMKISFHQETVHTLQGVVPVTLSQNSFLQLPCVSELTPPYKAILEQSPRGVERKEQELGAKQAQLRNSVLPLHLT